MSFHSNLYQFRKNKKKITLWNQHNSILTVGHFMVMDAKYFYEHIGQKILSSGYVAGGEGAFGEKAGAQDKRF